MKKHINSVVVTVRGNNNTVTVVSGSSVVQQSTRRPQDLEARRKAWNALQKAERRLRDMELNAEWVELRQQLNKAWERYNEKYGD